MQNYARTHILTLVNSEGDFKQIDKDTVYFWTVDNPRLLLKSHKEIPQKISCNEIEIDEKFKIVKCHLGKLDSESICETIKNNPYIFP